MVQLGVTQVPQQYILKRWSRDAETILIDQTNQQAGQQCVMTDDSKMKMMFAVMCAEMNKLATEACKSEDGRRIATSHIKSMKTELAALKKNQQKKQSNNSAATMSAQHTAHKHPRHLLLLKYTLPQVQACQLLSLQLHPSLLLNQLTLLLAATQVLWTPRHLIPKELGTHQSQALKAVRRQKHTSTHWILLSRKKEHAGSVGPKNMMHAHAKRRHGMETQLQLHKQPYNLCVLDGCNFLNSYISHNFSVTWNIPPETK